MDTRSKLKDKPIKEERTLQQTPSSSEPGADLRVFAEGIREMIPEFDPADIEVDVWIKQWKHWSRLAGWNSQDALGIPFDKLKAEARRHVFLTNWGQNLTLENIEAALLDRYRKDMEPRHEIWKKLANLKLTRDKTIQELFRTLTELSKKLGITEDSQKDIFFNALPNRFQQQFS